MMTVNIYYDYRMYVRNLYCEKYTYLQLIIKTDTTCIKIAIK